MNNESQSHNSSHIPLLLSVFVSLIILTLLTVISSQVNFGSPIIDNMVAMGIASIKGWLVLYYFMHLKWEDTLVKVFAAISLPFAFLMIGMDLMDLIFRLFEKQF